MDPWSSRIIWILSMTSVVLGQGIGQKVDLFCPDGMTANGQAWYIPRTTSNLYSSSNFSTCIRCKPSDRSPLKWIEVCFAKARNIMSDRFSHKSIHCNDAIPVGSKDYFQILDHCENGTTACGLRFTSTDVDLGTTLKTSMPIFCQENSTAPEMNSNLNETVLNCPSGSTVVRMIMFHRKEYNSWVPILSVLCQTSKSSNDVFFVDAHEKTERVSRDSIFSNFGAKCPKHSVKSSGSRCAVDHDHEGKFCGLKFENKASKGGPKVELLACNQTDGNIDKDDNDDDADVNSTTPIGGTTIQPVADNIEGESSYATTEFTTATPATESTKVRIDQNTTNPTSLTPMTPTTPTMASPPTTLPPVPMTTATTTMTPTVNSTTTMTTSEAVQTSTSVTTTKKPSKKKDITASSEPEVSTEHEDVKETEASHLNEDENSAHFSKVRLWTIAAVTSVISFVVGTAFAIVIVRWFRKRPQSEDESDIVQFRNSGRDFNEENIVLIHDIHLDD